MNNKKKILVVDDDPDILGVLGDFLADEGHEVVCVNNGTEALSKFCETDYDLSILDISMPILSGIDVLEKMREFKPGTKAIMVTAYHNPEVIKKVYKTGALNCIFKPFDLKDLRTAINDIFNKT
ncbi:MAG: response regulator [Elusimicrobia bacterium]|nr:response regulator [Candidatus Liberimonas magnetica]